MKLSLKKKTDEWTNKREHDPFFFHSKFAYDQQNESTLVQIINSYDFQKKQIANRCFSLTINRHCVRKEKKSSTNQRAESVTNMIWWILGKKKKKRKKKKTEKTSFGGNSLSCRLHSLAPKQFTKFHISARQNLKQAPKKQSNEKNKRKYKHLATAKVEKAYKREDEQRTVRLRTEAPTQNKYY